MLFPPTSAIVQDQNAIDCMSELDFFYFYSFEITFNAKNPCWDRAEEKNTITAIVFACNILLRGNFRIIFIGSQTNVFLIMLINFIYSKCLLLTAGGGTGKFTKIVLKITISFRLNCTTHKQNNWLTDVERYRSSFFSDISDVGFGFEAYNRYRQPWASMQTNQSYISGLTRCNK